MRSTLLACVALSFGFCGPEADASPRGRTLRTVQVIVMGAQPVAAPSSMDAPASVMGEGSDDRRETAPISLPAEFRAHDLSRRWVAFEMANSFAATPMQAEPYDQDPFANVGVASVDLPQRGTAVSLASPIAIPGWMREGVAFSNAPTSVAPGCSPGGYRPTGFLDPRAEYRRSGYYGMMSSIACEYGIPIGLFDAMIIRESGYDAGIYSSKNAFGLTQLMPDTAASLGVNRYDVEQNLRGGARYLRQQLDRFGQVHLALAAYNAGPGRVRGGVLPRIAETQAYVDNVLLNWRRLAGVPMSGATRNTAMKPPEAPARTGRLATVFSY